MRSAKFLGLLVLTLAPWAHAEEEEVAVAASTAAVASGPHDFASVNGQQGAGLSFSPEQKGRLYAELGFHTRSQENTFGGTTLNTSYTYVSWLLGGGYKITPEVELEVIVPMGFYDTSTTASASTDDFGDLSSSGLAIGNLHLGANWLKRAGAFRMKLGAALEFGPWNSNPSADTVGALYGGLLVRSQHDSGLWLPETFSIVTPSHIEFGDDFVVTGDFGLGLHLSTGGADPQISVQLDPGIGYYASKDALLGVRLPIVAVPTSDSDDKAQLAVEPFARVAIGSAFLNLRFTVNLDEPLGFAFDDGKVWALHLGGGGSF